MADNVNKEKIIIDFSTNANQAAKETNNLSASIEQTTEAVHGNTKAIGQEEQAYKSLKTQLREANLELQKQTDLYGETSAQAIQAAKAVGMVKDQIGAAKDLSEAFNPDQKFKALGAATQLAATGMQGVTAGMALFGDQSEDTEKMLLKVQAAMAFSDAISNLSNLGDQFNVFKSVVSSTFASIVAARQAETAATVQTTIAQRILNAVAKANPYVLLASAIAAVSIAAYAWYKSSSEAAKKAELAKVASENLTKAIDSQAKAFENNSDFISKNNNHKIALLKASGASESQIYAETKALQEQELQLAKNYRAQALRLEQTAYEQNRDNPTEFTKKTLADAQENIKKAELAVSKGYDNLIGLQNDHEVAVVQARTDARKKAEEDAEKARQKAIDDAKKAEADRIARLKAEYERRQAVLEELEAEQKRAADELIDTSYEDVEQKKTGHELAMADIAAKARQIDYDDQVAKDKAAAAAKLENQNLLVSQGEALIQNVAKLAGKNKAIQKAAIIADGGISVGKAVANTAEAVTKDLAKGAPFSAPLVALDLAVGATSIASIIQGTSKALQAVGGGSGPSAPSLPSAAGGVNSTPQTGFQASSENQIATSISNTQQALPPIKTYVVGQDVQTQIGLDAALVKDNSFGGSTKI